MCIVAFQLIYACLLNILINIIIQAQKDEECGNDELAKKKRQGVLTLNITPTVCYVITSIIFISLGIYGFVVVINAARAN